jgi:DNA-binding NarL/FixJ family response regulator
MSQRPAGIASTMNDARAAAPAPAPMAGEGVTDTAELARLINLMKQAEAVTSTRQPDIQIGAFTVPGSRVPASFIQGLKDLSKNEAAVLRFLGWGRSNADIAKLLEMNENTVRTHMNNAVAKLGTDGARELIGLGGLLFHPLD